MNFFLSKIAVSNYQFSTLYHPNILIQLIFIKRVFLFHRFRKKISTVSFSIFIFYGTSRNQRQQTAFYNYRATFYNVLAVNCSNDKKINWKSIGKLCNVRGYLLRDRIVFASKNIERVYTISGLFRVANIKSKVGIFCPVKERINHSAHGEFNPSPAYYDSEETGGRDSFEECRNYVRVRDAWREYLRIHCSPLFPDELSRPLRLSRGTVTTDIV